MTNSGAGKHMDSHLNLESRVGNRYAGTRTRSGHKLCVSDKTAEELNVNTNRCSDVALTDDVVKHCMIRAGAERCPQWEGSLAILQIAIRLSQIPMVEEEVT